MFDIGQYKNDRSYCSNLEAMLCQRESEGSSNGTDEGEPCKGGATEEGSVSVEGRIRNLVSRLVVRFCL
jgi:hypothetical protein